MSTPTQQTRDDRSELTTLITAAVLELTRQWNRLTVAQDRLLRTLERIRPGLGATTRINSYITAFHHEVGEFDRLTRAVAERWAAQDLPTAYRDGALRALRRANRDITLFRWTADHQAALTGLTSIFYVDLVARIQEAVRRAQAFARAAQEATRTVTLGRNHAGIDAPRLAADHPLSTVVYSDQARHPVKDWARSALTYQGAVTANHGAINTARLELEAEWMQVRDGDECGWTGHQDTDHADGTIRSIDDCAAYPVAHHGCVRELIPRPDLNGRRGLVSGDPA
ncbi:hypothetical protein D0Z67_29085 (plasmid) [Streptomyces seoulensis]|uniref:Phage head morphogenesis domain-containing protein n=1 Tax=Streptomyces seoulensis TaxID=73044 RepID=A0A4P6U501_STRSO|nr:hypothetical protein [Streptomyces seoulensis]QBJ94427.1 hypothetical protein D0Z67_29085 [Streptomyces seoulensis]